MDPAFYDCHVHGVSTSSRPPVHTSCDQTISREIGRGRRVGTIILNGRLRVNGITLIGLGLSCKTQEIYLIVFCLRYMDLFMYFVSLYNTCMKIFFITSTLFIIYLMRVRKPFKMTYDSLGDSFPHLMVLLPAAFVLTCIVQTGWSPWEFTWSYSLWLESLAFIP